MKRILDNQLGCFTPIENIKDSSIVGIDFKKDGGKAIIICTKEGYVGKHHYNTTLNKKDSEWTTETKREYVVEALKIKADAFIFDTIGELMKWCLE